MLDLVLAQVRELHLADLLDIVLVTTFVYSAITLLRHTQARLVAGGIVVLMTLFIAAQALDLRLTTWLLQGFFAVFLIILVVIFQEELRQLFERLALWGLRGTCRRRRPSAPPICWSVRRPTWRARARAPSSCWSARSRSIATCTAASSSAAVSASRC
jgi:hypothetical protein